MDFYKWDDRLKINHSKIDRDHKMIIEKARELSESMMKGNDRNQIMQTVDFLNRYVKTHFEEEERLQRQHGYPKLAEHQASHKYFVNQLSDLSMRIKADPTSAKNAIDLNKLISGWFVNHIKRMDVEVGAHIKHT
ncbi:bacteriohemerythrin [Fusibacter sp. JL298sf-3]